MKCPVCSSGETKVWYTRLASNGARTRRRDCGQCGARWQTCEAVVEDSISQAPSQPEWWAEARALRKEGLSQAKIAARLGRSQGMVARAINPNLRARVRKAKRIATALPGEREVINLKRRIRRERKRELASGTYQQSHPG